MKKATAAASKLDHHHSLTEGSLVEVCSDEEGFRGAWFVATLLRLPSPSPPSRSSKRNNNPIHNKAYVQYQTLLAKQGSSVLLREFVNADFLRPLPPPDTSPKTFQLGDVVDAYYSDGWWTGVITGIVPQGLRFVVTFQNPTHDIEFGLSELRFHREWVNCKWVRPGQQKAAALMFSVGETVEVSFDWEDRWDTWFPATILEDIGSGSFLVEYQSSKSSGDAALLKATVDYLHIRPCPPHLKEKVYSLLDKVDAFYNFGWSSGVITRELAHCRYLVYFKHTNREGKFNHLELRPHMDWKGGKWFTSSQDIVNPSDYQKHEGHVYNNVHSTEMKVPPANSGITESIPEEKTPFSLNSGENQVELSTPCNEEPPRVTSSLKERTLESPSLCSGKEMLKGEIPALPQKLASQMSTDRSATVGKTKFYDLGIPSSETMGHSISKQTLGGSGSSDKHSWGKRVKRKRTKICEEDDNPTSGSGKTSGSSRNLQVKIPPNSVEGTEGNAVRDAAEGVQQECMSVETNRPIVLGLECDKASNSSPKKTYECSGEEVLKHNGNRAGLNDNELPSIKDGNQLDFHEKIQKRGRGRPRKVTIKASIASASDEPRRGVIADELLVKEVMAGENYSLKDVEVKSAIWDFSVSSHERVNNGSGKKLIINQEKQKNKKGSTAITSLLRKPSKEAVDASAKQQERHSSKRARRRTINVNIVSQVQDSTHATVGRKAESNCMTKELETVVEELPNHIFEDQPLSKWFQEMHSPTNTDTSRVSPASTVAHCAVASNGQLEVVKEKLAVDKIKIVGSELHSLPFVKNTLLWSTVESMEVFQKLPQRPHFRPLEHCKESSREGLAIGHMVTFCSVIERTSRMQFDDPKSTIDDILETLLELESHGFDVRAVQDRASNLLAMKEKQEKLQHQLEQLHDEIKKHNLEKTKIDEEMDEIKKQIKSLQEKLSQATSMKETKDREIASLESKLEGITEGIGNVQCVFKVLATSLL